VFVKVTRPPFAILILLAAAACSRQPGKSSPGDGLSEDSTVISDGYGRPSVSHDPRAMTSIDVATGDLSGFADYAGGRAIPPPADRAAPSQQAVAALPAQVVEGAVAAAQDGVGELTNAAASPTTENTTAAQLAP
jgi:hypothetical protein